MKFCLSAGVGQSYGKMAVCLNYCQRFSLWAKHNCGCIISLVWQSLAEVHAWMANYASTVDFLFFLFSVPENWGITGQSIVTYFYVIHLMEALLALVKILVTIIMK